MTYYILDDHFGELPLTIQEETRLANYYEDLRIEIAHGRPRHCDMTAGARLDRALAMLAVEFERKTSK